MNFLKKNAALLTAAALIAGGVVWASNNVPQVQTKIG